MSPLFEMAAVTALASVRVTALFVTAPMFSHRAMPQRLRAALGMTIAFLVSPEIPADLLASSTGELWALVIQEAIVGVFLGFAAGLVFAGFDMLGEFMSIQGGLGAAAVVDPASGANSLALATLLRTFALLVFLALDGHHELLRALAVSYEHMPIGAAMPSAFAFLELVNLGGAVFEIAVRLAAPITVAMMLSNMGMGILGRVIPQLNLMMLQLPAHVAFTLGLLMLGAGSVIRAAEQWIAIWPNEVVSALVTGQ